MNWVSGKMKVWASEERKGSSEPSSFTSTTWRRGWYLCSDWRTIIWGGNTSTFNIISSNLNHPVVGRNRTCAELLVLPLLLVSFSLLKDTSCLIQWAPVFGESGCMYILFPDNMTIGNNVKLLISFICVVHNWGKLWSVQRHSYISFVESVTPVQCSHQIYN